MLFRRKENKCVSSIRPQKDHRNHHSYLVHSRIPQMSVFISGPRIFTCWDLLSPRCVALAWVPAMWSVICLLLVEMPHRAHPCPAHMLLHHTSLSWSTHSPCSSEPDYLCWTNSWPGAPNPGTFVCTCSRGFAGVDRTLLAEAEEWQLEVSCTRMCLGLVARMQTAVLQSLHLSPFQLPL